MSRSKRQHEGVIIMDNRESPGVPAGMMHARGLPVAAGKGLYEAPTFTCSHCPRVVQMNPKRTRVREYCRKCDHYICDRCAGIMAVTKECKTYRQILDELQESASKPEGVIYHG